MFRAFLRLEEEEKFHSSLIVPYLFSIYSFWVIPTPGDLRLTFYHWKRRGSVSWE